MATGKTNAGGVADLAVTTEKIASKAVTTGKIADKAVTTAQLGDASVGTAQLDALAVSAAKLAASAVETAKIKDSAVTTAKIKDGAVTRAKLAQDALFSPIVVVSEDRNIAQSDLGKTLVGNYSSTKRVLTLTQETSANLPIGFEFAVCRIYYPVYQIKFSGVRVIFDGKQHSSKEDTKLVDLPEVGTMIALKKFDANRDYGDIWLLTGPAEVVS